MNPYRVSPEARLELRRIGTEAQPLLIIDDVLAEPQSLIAAACAACWYVPEHTRYPGVNARLPDSYYTTLVNALRAPLEAAFGIPKSAYLDFFGYFGLTTTPADRAEPIQKIPHYDGPDSGRVAMVHYLCTEPFDGTGFYRHRATGFEAVDRAREPAYVAAAKAELEADAPSLTGYGDSPRYERIAEAGMRFNRLVVYRGHVLHSALLGNVALPADPATGRLTANGFISLRGGGKKNFKSD